MRISHLLLRNYRHKATIVPARMKPNGNFSEANLESSGVQPVDCDLHVDRGLLPSRPRGLFEKKFSAVASN